MSNRLEERVRGLLARGERGLAPFVTAGDGGLDTTLAVLRALDEAGVTCVELGLPFSDPIADGPLLQAASQRALEAGTTFDGLLELLAELRTTSDLPVAVMGYANPFVRRGFGAALGALAEAGADAVLIADLPVEEGAPLIAAARATDLCPIFFASPTSSDERIARAAAASRGFLYAIGRTGVTGAATDLDEATQSFLERVKRQAGELPVAVGFGIATAPQVAAATRHATLAIVGSALVRRLYEAAGQLSADLRPTRAAAAARAFATDLMGGLAS